MVVRSAPAAMSADVSRHTLGRTEGRGLGSGQLVRTHTGKCLKCQSSSDGIRREVEADAVGVIITQHNSHCRTIARGSGGRQWKCRKSHSVRLVLFFCFCFVLLLLVCVSVCVCVCVCVCARARACVLFISFKSIH